MTWDRLLQAAVALIGVPAALVGYITLVEVALRVLPVRRRAAARPWLWLLPALAFLLVFLVYPALNTIVLSFLNNNSSQSVGLANYQYVFTNNATLSALRNNAVWWLIIFTLAAVVIGLLMAVLTDRVPYESAAKALMFLPMAISAVAAGVIWRFMYDFRPVGAEQTGTLNAALIAVAPGFEPQAWLINAPFNNLALVTPEVWIWAGFSMVILSAGLKGISSELLEAARMDGANEWHVFWNVTLPLLAPTVAVVVTTLLITSLKEFAVVYVMTNGNYDTEVIANRMYKEMFNVRDFGRASALAVVMLAAIVPIMLFNLRRFRDQEATR